MRKPWLAVVWVFLFWCPSFALASLVTDEPQLVSGIEVAEESQTSFFEAAAQEVDVPPELTQAIARVESGGTSYALNVEGRGYFFDSKEEALAAASEAQAAGKSFDSGVMQINNWWLQRYDIPLEAVFDPAANILLGSWILRQELDRHGDSWTAVARYHSPNTARGNQYVALVRKALEKGPIQTASKPAQNSSLVHSKKEEVVAAVPHASLQGVATSLVVYRKMDRPVWARVPADHINQEHLQIKMNVPFGPPKEIELRIENQAFVRRMP
jgi:hypothetical protein